MSLSSNDLLAAADIVSTALAFAISVQVYRVYRYTSRSYLLNFFVSFIMLGASYYLLALPLQPTGSSLITRGLEWPRLIIQSVAYIMLASTYFSRTRRG